MRVAGILIEYLEDGKPTGEYVFRKPHDPFPATSSSYRWQHLYAPYDGERVTLGPPAEVCECRLRSPSDDS